MENEHLRVFIKSTLTKELVQQLATSFVQDNDFTSDWRNCETIMTKTLKDTRNYMRLHQEEFNSIKLVFLLEIEERNGKFKSENIESTLEANVTCTNKLKVNDSRRTLGVNMHPKLHWDGKFIVTKTK